LVLAFWLVHWVTKKVTTINNSHDGISKKIDKVEANVDDMRKDLSYVKGSLDIVKETLNIFRNGISPLVESCSPVSLTQRGKEISKELNAEDIICRNWTKIYDNLEENICNKNAYDIQQYCLYTAAVELEKFISKEDIDFLKKIAYQQGNPLLYYSSVFGIIIRDKYLSIKGINMSEVDKHDPNRTSN
jgi:hypothetical protein